VRCPAASSHDTTHPIGPDESPGEVVLAHETGAHQPVPEHEQVRSRQQGGEIEKRLRS
jgi:hypothetical protein